MCRPPDNNDPLPERFVLVTNFRTHNLSNSQLRALRPHNSQPTTSVRISPILTMLYFPYLGSVILPNKKCKTAHIPKFNQFRRLINQNPRGQQRHKKPTRSKRSRFRPAMNGFA